VLLSAIGRAFDCFYPEIPMSHRSRASHKRAENSNYDHSHDGASVRQKQRALSNFALKRRGTFNRWRETAKYPVKLGPRRTKELRIEIIGIFHRFLLQRSNLHWYAY
jgi:hypothetical protein